MNTDLQAVTVLLVDDNALIRRGIRSVLDQYEDVRIIAEATNGLEAIQYARMLGPDLILMDIRMPEMDGVQATRIIKQEQPDCVIVGLSVVQTGPMREALLQAGATTFLSKDCVTMELYAAIQKLLPGFRRSH
jgi:DNA-binding NarL/FixJ family response regulator